MGKDRPPGLNLKFEGECGRGVASLVLRLLEPWFGTGRTVHLDSGFCVLVLMALLVKNGLWPNSQVKKRRYWPKHMPVDAIEAQLATMKIGDFGVHEGEFLKQKIFFVYVKGDEYNSIFMTGFAPNQRGGKGQNRRNGQVKFQCPLN